MRISFRISLPSSLGNDLAGEVVALGPGVEGTKIGDEVMAMLELGHPGAYAEYAVVPARLLAKKPANLDFTNAAAVPLAGLTALQLLRRSRRFTKGARVLVNGASGGVGSFVIQIAKAGGAVVTGVTSGKNMDLVRSLGADAVLDYTQEDALHGGPYDVVVDTVGNMSFWRARKALASEGAFVSSDPSPGLFIAHALTSFSRKRAFAGVVKPSAEDLHTIAELIVQGKVRPLVERVFSLSEAQDAHRHLETNRTRGKLVFAIAS